MKYILLSLSLFLLVSCSHKKLLVKDCSDPDVDGYRICDKI